MLIAYINIHPVSENRNMVHDKAIYEELWQEGITLIQHGNEIIPSLLQDPNVPVVNLRTQFRKLKRHASSLTLEMDTLRTLRKSLRRLRFTVKKYEKLLERIPESTEL